MADSLIPIFIGAGIQPGQAPVEQPGAYFSDKFYGWDDGRVAYLVHPLTSETKWPKVGDPHAKHKTMYAESVVPRATESTLIELDVCYRGSRRKTKEPRVLPDADIQMLSLPVYAGGSMNMLLPLPQPTCTIEYISTVQPNYDGVGATASGDALPDAPAIALSFVPDPSRPPTINYFTGWVLQGRSWEDIAKKIWLVRERYAYYYPIASA